ncbi:GD14756 [Drosophila simulans]|uniref:GD14756 n=1 Tax=Drosophila simulans TaxID=7240 RepID=B4QPT7_DROSI|nr:GD14756 [Drosophila simulans]
MKSFWSSFIFLLFWSPIMGDNSGEFLNVENNTVYSSIAGLLKLLKLEEIFITNIKAYTNKLAEKVKNLQAYIDSVDYEFQQSFEDREKYVGNPINAFSLVRRTHQDLPKWHNYSQQIVGIEELFALEEIIDKIPDNKDMEYSLGKMHRLEQIYDLEAIELARGRIQSKQYNFRPSIRDCVALGEHKFKREEYQRASMWFRMAIKHEPEGNAEIINSILGDPKVKLYTLYAKSMLIFGMIKSNPSMTIAEAKKISYEALSKASLADVKSLLNELLSQTDDEIVYEMNVNKTKPSDYEIGCRGQFLGRRNHVCSYNFTITEFLRLAPLKQEVLNWDPYIVIYHNVLKDDEIDKLKQHSNDNAAEVVNPIEKRIFQRINELTRLSFLNQLIVSKNGPGTQKHIKEYSKGTLLFFVSTFSFAIYIYISLLNNVELGGATVFPKLKISVFPQKGSCLIWYNTPDPRSEPLECPVLQGNKWGT